MVRVYAPSCALLLIFLVAYFCYRPGLEGGFLFDDYPNLKDLGGYGGVVDWESFRSFVFNGWSGPTGRPISLMSFLLDDNTWPSHAPWFKLTNLLIHLLNGLLLCWATLLLLQSLRFPERNAVWVALVASAIWVLHPYFVSTTLYVVQRMAQLATLFVLLGFVGYLKGRLFLLESKRVGYFWMSFSLVSCTALATLSKENGILLPLLVLTAELCMPSTDKPDWRWRLLFLWGPSVAIGVALLSYVDFSENPWPTRSFNQVERLLTEGRIVTEYLLHLVVPSIEGHGLFQDGYQLSIGFLSPPSTLIALLFIAVLLVGALLLRRVVPLVSFAILFFLAAHLVESTVIGLELYFEHRNYMAALFLFLPIAAGVVRLADMVRPGVAILVGVLLLLMLSFMTWQRATLWSNSSKLELFWAQASPDSPRAQNTIATYLVSQGRVDEAEKYIEAASSRLPESSLLTIRLLLLKVYSRTAVYEDFIVSGNRLAEQPFDAQTVSGLRTLAEAILEQKSQTYAVMAVELLDTVSSNSKYQQFPLFRRLMPYLKGQLLCLQGKGEEAFSAYSQAMKLYADTDAALMMVAEMASSGYSRYSLSLLGEAEGIFKYQADSALKRSRAVYVMEFERMRNLLQSSIAVEQ